MLTYAEWTKRHGDTIRDNGPRMAALLAGVPMGYIERYRQESAHRRAVAVKLGGVSEFYFPLAVAGGRG